MLLSLNVPVAVNCCVLLTPTCGFAGVIAIEVSVPLLTVSVVVALTPDELAVMVTLPSFLPNARPELRMDAMLGLEDFQLNPLRLLAMLLSLNVPLAVNFSKVPCSIRGLLGLMVMLTSLALETLRFVTPTTEPTVALITVVPVARLVASPWLLMVAAAGVEEPQSTLAVMSCVVLSLNVPVAVNWRVVPMLMLELAGVTAIDCSVAAVTLRETVPLTAPEVAEMVTLPVPVLVARPEELMDAILPSADDQVTFVSCCVLPSSKEPVAVN